MNYIVIRCIRFYQIIISPDTGILGFLVMGKCRYYPSCSHFAEQSFQKYTFNKALRLTLARVISCNPWSRRPIVNLP